MRLCAIFLLAVFLGCSSARPVEPVAAGSAWNLPLIQGPGYSGVIFPEERAAGAAEAFGIKVSGYWTPDSEVIARLESRLRPALESGLETPELIAHLSADYPAHRAYVVGEVAKVLEHLAEYKRQYVGIVLPDGEKRVLVNCFRPFEGIQELKDGWRQQIVVVDDGGFWFWRIQFAVANQQYLGFESNGYA